MMAPVFSVGPYWDTFPHLCIAVLCFSAQLIYRRRMLDEKKSLSSLYFLSKDGAPVSR